MNVTTKLRNRDFIRCCTKQYCFMKGQGLSPSLMQIVMRALAGPAPAYYVDPYRANRVLTGALDGCPLPGGGSRAGRQWRDMLADLRRLQRAEPCVNSRRHIDQLCSGRRGRPRFYISVRRALEIAHLHFVEGLAVVECAEGGVV